MIDEEVCDDGLDCTFDFCDPNTGQCVHISIDSNCDDGDPCTQDICDPASGGCIHIGVEPRYQVLIHQCGLPDDRPAGSRIRMLRLSRGLGNKVLPGEYFISCRPFIAFSGGGDGKSHDRCLAAHWDINDPDVFLII